MKIPLASHQLTNQYRMHSEICHWPNREFYNNQINCGHYIDTNFPLKPFTVLDSSVQLTDQQESVEIMNIIRSMNKVVSSHPYSCGVITPNTELQMKLRLQLRYVRM